MELENNFYRQQWSRDLFTLLLYLSGFALIVGVVFLLLGLAGGYGAATSMGLYSLLVMAVLLTFTIFIWTRPSPLSSPLPPPPHLGPPAPPLPPPPFWEYAFSNYRLVPFLFALPVLFLQMVIMDYLPRSEWTTAAQTYLGIFLIILAGAIVGGQRTLKRLWEPEAPILGQLGPWLSSWATVTTVLAVAALAGAAGWLPAYLGIVSGVRYATLLVAIFLLLELPIRYYFSPDTDRLHLTIIPLQLLFSRGAFPARETLGTLFSIDSRSAWLWRTIRRVIRPALVIVPLLLWLSTSAVVVQINEQGVLERWGKLHPRSPLGPGLHVVAPWPIDTVKIFSTSTIRTMTVGYTGDPEAKAMLWTRAHGTSEPPFLLGDGRSRQELLAVNVLMYYRIADIIRFAYASQDPESALRLLAERAVLLETAGGSLEEILTVNRRGFQERLMNRIRTAVAGEQLGVEVIDVALQALHPPIDVAADYQAVVSAEIEKKTVVLEAEAGRAEAIPAAQTRALDMVRESTGLAASRRGRATGESTNFRLLQAAYTAAPDLFCFRRRLETLDSVLTGKKFVVIDKEMLNDMDLLFDARPLGAAPSRTGTE